jgi:hypothetical protein
VAVPLWYWLVLSRFRDFVTPRNLHRRQTRDCPRQKSDWEIDGELPKRESRTKTELEKQNRIDAAALPRPQVIEKTENSARPDRIKKWPSYCIVRCGCIS